jgi:hypothetical protein
MPMRRGKMTDLSQLESGRRKLLSKSLCLGLRRAWLGSDRRILGWMLLQSLSLVVWVGGLPLGAADVVTMLHAGLLCKR